jgi:hypothetical protein
MVMGTPPEMGRSHCNDCNPLMLDTTLYTKKNDRISLELLKTWTMPGESAPLIATTIFVDSQAKHTTYF